MLMMNPPPVFFHFRDGEVTAIEDAVQVGADRGSPFLDRHLVDMLTGLEQRQRC